MNILYPLLLMFALAFSACAQVSNPVNHFESLGPGIQPVMKWHADVNGDGKDEVFLSLKDEYEQDLASDQAPGWFVYISNGAGTHYNLSTGIREQGESAVGAAVPMIDPKVCFIGLVSELGEHAIITMQIDNPRIGKPIARIFAYTIEEGHLKRTKLAEYDASQENALFDKYLEDDKRAVIMPVEVTP